MHLVTGELRSIRITSDMVDKTLVHDGAVHLIDGALPVLPALRGMAGTEAPKDAAFAEARKGAGPQRASRPAGEAAMLLPRSAATLSAPRSASTRRHG